MQKHKKYQPNSEQTLTVLVFFNTLNLSNYYDDTSSPCVLSNSDHVIKCKNNENDEITCSAFLEKKKINT